MEKLSVSAASKFKSCPRRYYFEEILGYEPAQKPSWLNIGSQYDKLLEFYDLGGLQGAIDAVPGIFNDPYAQVDAKFILAHYHSKFQHDPLPPVQNGNQVGFGIPYFGNEVTGPLEMKVTGYIDKVSQEGDELTVVERKTTAESIEDGSEFWKKLPLDEQVRCYPFALKAMGNNAGKVVYEVIRKLSTTVNRVYAKDCSVEEYTNRLSNHVEKKTLVARRIIYVTQDMCDDFITSHAMTFLQIQACKAKQAEIEALGYDGMYAWQKHQGSCSSYGGCPHRAVDEGLITHEQGDFVKSDKWKKANAPKELL